MIKGNRLKRNESTFDVDFRFRVCNIIPWQTYRVCLVSTDRTTKQKNANSWNDENKWGIKWKYVYLNIVWLFALPPSQSFNYLFFLFEPVLNNFAGFCSQRGHVSCKSNFIVYFSLFHRIVSFRFRYNCAYLYWIHTNFADWIKFHWISIFKNDAKQH